VVSKNTRCERKKTGQGPVADPFAVKIDF